MGTEKFCLRWNDFESNISVAFRELREDKDFFDVTLTCDDEQQLQAHKVILSACSPFFRNILRRNPHQHPLLYLKGVKYTDLQSVLNFMYHGEVNVAQEELNSFLAVAEDLRVKGLTQSNQSSSGAKHSASSSSSAAPRSPPSSQKLGRPPSEPPSSAPPAKRSRSSAASTLPPPSSASFTQSSTGNSEDDDIQEVVPVKSEPRDLVAPVSETAAAAAGAAGTDPYSNALATEDDGAYDESYEDYGQYDQSYDGTLADPSMGADGNKGPLMESLSSIIETMYAPSPLGRGYVCSVCGKQCADRTVAKNHVEAMHAPSSGHNCQVCGKWQATKNALNSHTYRYHKKNWVHN